MAEEPRFDWPGIFRVVTIIVGITAFAGFVVPPVATLALGLYNTGTAAGHVIYQWGFWLLAWGLTIWQGSWMLRRVGDKIIDDMLVVSMIAAVALVIIKFVIAVAYQPIGPDGQIFFLNGTDAGGALLLIVVALVGARINKY